MFRYSGFDFNRFYLAKKDKKVVWRLAIADRGDYLADFEDVRDLYKKLFDRWEDPRFWEDAESFLDGHY